MTKESATLNAELRSETGTGATRQLRRSGRLPAVVYGRRDETQSLTLDTQELVRLLTEIRAATTVIDLEVGGEKPRRVLIREIQRHPFRSELLHVDFFEIRADVKIKVQVPLHLEGEAYGVEMGGILQQIRHELEVECLPNEIPPDFTVDVTDLDIGNSIHISDVELSGVTILDDEGLTVCTVVPPAVEEEPEVEELEEGEEGEEIEGDESEPTDDSAEEEEESEA
jgi:large subunit ribosomal protein L25